jgi:hypothetical protein
LIIIESAGVPTAATNSYAMLPAFAENEPQMLDLIVSTFSALARRTTAKTS